MIDDRKALLELIGQIEAQRGSRVITYWMTDLARISDAAIPTLFDQLTGGGQTKRIDLILFTRGGDTEAPWRVVSLIREYCENFAVMIPHRAHSAGTLVALGADEIVTTPLSELGPIDPSRTHPLLPTSPGGKQSQPISVQDLRHAMQFVRESAPVGGYTPDALANIFAALFDKIHPLAIGAIEQSYALSKLIATRCLETHMDPVKEADKIKALADVMCDGFKSHVYQINRREAKRIGLKVVDAPAQLEVLLLDLLRLYSVRSRVTPPQIRAPTAMTLNIAWMDSRQLQFRVEANYLAQPTGELEAKGDRWAAY